MWPGPEGQSLKRAAECYATQGNRYSHSSENIHKTFLLACRQGHNSGVFWLNWREQTSEVLVLQIASPFWDDTIWACCYKGQRSWDQDSVLCRFIVNWVSMGVRRLQPSWVGSISNPFETVLQCEHSISYNCGWLHKLSKIQILDCKFYSWRCTLPYI